jgi:hypothetical protein
MDPKDRPHDMIAKSAQITASFLPQITDNIRRAVS